MIQSEEIVDLNRKIEFEFDDKHSVLSVSGPNGPIRTDTPEKLGVEIAGLKIVAIGDPHFRIDNLDEISVYISRIEIFVRNEKPDFVVVLGDLLHCHERVHTTVLNKAYQFIHKLRQYQPVYVLVGNHDYINNSQFLSENHWMTAMKEWNNVHVVDNGTFLNTIYGKFIFCPYVYPGKFIEALDIIDSDWKSARTIFCHQEFFGCSMGAIQSVEGDKWEKHYPFIISGHIHNKQRLQENIFYTGSSIQHAFGESHDKTIALCHFNNTILCEGIDLQLPRKKIMYMDVDTVNDFKFQKGKDHLRITVSGTFDEFKTFRKSKKYKQLVTDGVKIVYKTNVDKNSTETVVKEEFHDILYKLIKHDYDMIQLYKELVAL